MHGQTRRPNHMTDDRPMAAAYPQFFPMQKVGLSELVLTVRPRCADSSAYSECHRPGSTLKMSRMYIHEHVQRAYNTYGDLGIKANALKFTLERSKKQEYSISTKMNKRICTVHQLWNITHYTHTTHESWKNDPYKTKNKMTQYWKLELTFECNKRQDHTESCASTWNEFSWPSLS